MKNIDTVRCILIMRIQNILCTFVVFSKIYTVYLVLEYLN